MWLRNKSIGVLTTKLGYEAKIEEEISGERFGGGNWCGNYKAHSKLESFFY